jgi:hypothetical protein
VPQQVPVYRCSSSVRLYPPIVLRRESVRRSESLCKGEFRVSLGPIYPKLGVHIYPKLGVHTRMRLAAALATWDGATGALIFRRPKCKFRTGGWRDA